MFDIPFYGPRSTRRTTPTGAALTIPRSTRRSRKPRLILDPDERAEAWAEVDRLAMEQAPAVPWMWENTSVVAVRERRGRCQPVQRAVGPQLHVAEVGDPARTEPKKGPAVGGRRRGLDPGLTAMLRYIVRRVLWCVAMLVVVSAVVFVLFYVFPTRRPGEAARRAAASAELVEKIREQLHPQRPDLRCSSGSTSKGVVLPFDFGTASRTTSRSARSSSTACRRRSCSSAERWCFGWRSGSRRDHLRPEAPIDARPDDDDHDPGIHLCAGVLARPRRPLPVRRRRRA